MSAFVRKNLIYTWLTSVTLLLGVIAWGQASAEREVTGFVEIDVQRINGLTFAYGSGLAGVAGTIAELGDQLLLAFLGQRHAAGEASRVTTGCQLRWWARSRW